MMEYPERTSHFAHKHFRLMTKVCAAQEIGATAMVLVAVVAHQEDAIRYSRAVTFYNGQLTALVGAGSDKTMIVARKRAVDAGWLHYEPGGKSRPGKYWVLAPDHTAHADDSPIEESSDDFGDVSPPVSPVGFTEQTGGQNISPVNPTEQTQSKRRVNAEERATIQPCP